MNTGRRKFIKKSLLLGSSISFASYALSRNKPLTVQKSDRDIDNTAHATYENTKHNRQFYASTRF